MDKIDLLQIVALQREKLKDEYEKPGWNLWALFGAFSSLLWLIINELKDSIFNWITTLFLFFLILASLAFLRSIRILFPQKKSSKGYHYFRDEILHSIWIFIFSLATIAFTYFFTYKFGIFKFRTSEVLFHFHYAILILFFLGLAFFYYKNPEVKENFSHRKEKVVRVFMSILFIVLEANLIFIYYLKVRDSSVVEIRLALLLFGLHFVFTKILRDINRNSLLNKINELIDDITFDRVAAEDAQERLRLIILGLQFKDIISPFVEDHIALSKKFGANCDKIANRFQLFSTEPNSNQKEILLDSIDQLMSEIGELLPQIKTTQKNIFSRLKRFRTFERDNPEYNEIKELLDSLENERRLKWQEIEEKIKIAHATL